MVRLVYGGSEIGTTKSDGHSLRATNAAAEVESNQQQDPAKRVRPVTRINGARIYFRQLAEMAYPNKTEANLAFIAHVDVRTARRWLSIDTDIEPPADVLGVVLAEIMRRYGQR